MDDYAQDIPKIFAVISSVVDQSSEHRYADASEIALIQIHRKIGHRQSKNIERLAIVDELQRQARIVESLAGKFYAARAIAITIPANIGDDFLHHQLDDAQLLALAQRTQRSTASIVGAVMRSLITRFAIAAILCRTMQQRLERSPPILRAR